MVVIEIIYNLAILVTVSVGSGFIDARWNKNTHTGKILQGVTFGFIAMLAMLNPFVLAPGIIFDGRSIVLSLCALFFGPIAGGIAGAIAFATRMVIGGDGATMGGAVIISSVSIGLIVNRVRRLKPFPVTVKSLYIFGMVVNCVMLLLMMFLPKNFLWMTFQTIAISVIVFYPIATVIIGKVIIDQGNRISLIDELRESEEKYRTLVQYSNDPICALNPDETFRFVNDAFAKSYHKKPEEIIGKTPASFTPPEGSQEQLALVRRVLHTGEQGEATIRVRTASGEEKFFLTMADAIKDGQGNILWVSCFIKDITKQRIADETIRQLSQVVEQSPVSIIITDTSGSIEYVNPKFVELTGYSREEVLGRNPRFLKSGHTLPEEYKQVWETILSGGEWHGELHNRKKNGDLFWLSVKISPIMNDKGEITHFLAIQEDITERKRTFESLLASEEKFRKTFMTSPDAICINRMSDGAFISINQGFTEITGYEETDVIGRTPTGLDLWDDMAVRNALLGDLREHGAIRNIEIEFKGKKGATIYGLLSSSVIELEGIQCSLSITRDVTNRKLAEMNLRRIEERLKLSEKMEAIGQLAGGIAHDFNNVLGGIIGYTDLSLDLVKKDSVLEKNMLNVLKASNRAKHLVKQILAFSRQSSNQMSIISVDRIITEVADLLKSSIPSSVIIQTDLHSDVKPILGDATQIHQVILNLATNAVHAMDRKGTLTLRLSTAMLMDAQEGVTGEISPGEYTVIEVSDTGCGMEASTLSKAFEPFFTTKPVGEGTGMGLSVVLGIVQSHHGSIKVKSVVGEGTAFKIFIPVSTESVTTNSAETSWNALQGSERILLVDDEPMLLEVTTESLAPLGYAITSMTDSLEALNYIKEHAGDIDLLVTDQTMPSLLGTELASEVKKIRNDLPIILCTGNSRDLSSKQISAIGISRVVMKPYSITEITASIRDVLDANIRKATRG